jgi:putative flippase GtrA
VGSSAALVNFTVVVIIVELGLLSPLLANVIAFFIAFQVSYFGHRYWTFQESVSLHRVAMPRLLLVSGLNFIANESLFYFFIHHFKLPYPIALLIVLATLPALTFTFSKLWVFR